jgi:flagellar basal body-associated protein FliL
MNTEGRHDIKDQRKKAVKTALVLGFVAVVIFIAFILSGVLGT